MKTSTEINIRFADCDALGHTNNAKYFTFMEQARVALFRDLLTPLNDHQDWSQRFPFILAEITCQFLKPTFTDETLLVEALVTEVKNSSFFIEYQLKRKTDGELVAKGKSVQVWYDYTHNKSQPIPDELKQKLLQ